MQRPRPLLAEVGDKVRGVYESPQAAPLRRGVEALSSRFSSAAFQVVESPAVQPVVGYFNSAIESVKCLIPQEKAVCREEHHGPSDVTPSKRFVRFKHPIEM
mmetsp:Transcript_49339/g.100746  ORF Transcript_49339/g.100746 Transcript_49339/m.100746 type:complete len:102 (+) Transcript_49339:3-308(+)